MNREDHHAAALHWLAIAESAYGDIPDNGTLPVVGAASIAQVHATLATYAAPVEIVSEFHRHAARQEATRRPGRG